jgi:hypothetical protein
MAMTTSINVKPPDTARALRNRQPGVLQLFKRTFMIEFTFEGTTAHLRRHSAAPSFQLSNTCLSVSYTKQSTFNPSAMAKISPGKSPVFVWNAAFVGWNLRNARIVFESVADGWRGATVLGIHLEALAVGMAVQGCRGFRQAGDRMRFYPVHIARVGTWIHESVHGA